MNKLQMNKRYIAFLDILGFKELIENNSHKDIVCLFDNFRIFVQMALAKQKGTIDKWGRLVYDVSNTKINSIIISDSLIFWTNDNEPNDFFDLVDCLQRFMKFCHNLPKIFVRGGISYGDFFYDNSGTIHGNDSIIMHPIIVGKALVELHLIEKELQFAGCVIDKVALNQVKKDDRANFDHKWKSLIREKLIVEYEVPYKSTFQTEWTINWVSDSIDVERDFEKDFSNRNKSILQNDVKEKISNTKKYYDFVREKIYKIHD